MFVNVDFIEDLHDLSVFADQKRRALDAHVLFAVHRLFDPHTVLFDHVVLGVGDQIEIEPVLRPKPLVRLFAVGRNAEQLDVLFFKGFVRVPERACFLGSARRVVLWVKEQDDSPAPEVRELNGVAVLVPGSKIRCLIAFLEHKP